MDSITQMALGAALGEATMGHRIGRRAALWGALLGTLPDLDALIPHADPVASFTYHRSFSHSLLVLGLLSPLLAWLLLKLHARTEAGLRHWWLLTATVLLTHPLLDSLTVYGTQLLWPLDPTPAFWASVFIIDPLVTVPLLLGLGLTLRRRRRITGRERYAARPNLLGLSLALLYLGWGLTAKQQLEVQVRSQLADTGFESAQVLSVPTPANTLLWRVLVVTDAHYLEGFRSVFDRSSAIRFMRYPRNAELIAPLAEHWPVARLDWFTHGFWAASRDEQWIRLIDLRMGQEPHYAFSFRVGRLKDSGTVVPVTTEQLPMAFERASLAWVWQRIWQEPDADTPLARP